MDNPFEMAHCLGSNQLQERLNFIDEEMERLKELRKVVSFAMDIQMAEEVGNIIKNAEPGDS